MYRRALATDSATAETRERVIQYVADTQELLAALEYVAIEPGFSAALHDIDGVAPTPSQTRTVLETISDFRALVDAYPSSASAQIALVQIGDAYVQLERWRDAAAAFTELVDLYVDAGGPESPRRTRTCSGHCVGASRNLSRSLST